MEYVELHDGGKIEKKFFDQILAELRKECWEFKDIATLEMDHVHCELTFDTISTSYSKGYYQSTVGSIISCNTFDKYIKDCNSSE